MLLALAAALVAAPHGMSAEIAVDRPAPAHRLRVWLERGRDPGADLADLRGSVVVVRAFDWRGPQDFRQVSPLIGDLLAANADRRLSVLGIAAPRRDVDVDARARQMGLEHPIALCAPGKSPYFDPEATGLPFACVVGPNGEVVWRGDPAAEQAAFLASVQDALGRHAGLDFDDPLPAEFDGVLGAWYRGRWDEARRDARALGAHDARFTTTAERFVRHVDAFEQRCARDLRALHAADRPLAFCRLVDAFGRGFPRSRALREALATFEEERLRRGGWRWTEAQCYAQLERDRPVLFPTRPDEPGKRYLARLRKTLRNAREETEVTRLARSLIAAHEER